MFYIFTKCFRNLEKYIPTCLFCIEEHESSIHLFHSCTKTNFIWTQLQGSFKKLLILPPITPQSAISGFTDYKVNYHLINHTLLIFNYYFYKTRENGSLELKVLKRKIHKRKKDIEKDVTSTNQKKENILNRNGNHC